MREWSASLVPAGTQEIVWDAQPEAELVERLPPRSIEPEDLQPGEEAPRVGRGWALLSAVEKTQIHCWSGLWVHARARGRKSSPNTAVLLRQWSVHTQQRPKTRIRYFVYRNFASRRLRKKIRASVGSLENTPQQPSQPKKLLHEKLTFCINVDSSTARSKMDSNSLKLEIGI